MRELGVAHSDAPTVYFALDPATTIGLVSVQDGPSDISPAEVSEAIELGIQVKESRRYVVILQGDLAYLKKHRRAYKLRFSNDYVIVYISDPQTLSKLGVSIVDADWQSGQQQLDLESLLAAE